MKVAVWNQSCTYGIFTLLPILLFILVTLWKMKAAHDNEMTKIRWELDKAKEELNKAAYIHSDAEEELKQKKEMMTKMTAERMKLVNKTDMLQDEIKLVEDKVLNLTRKLLLKEVEAGIEKEKNRRLLETIEDLKKKAAKEQTKNDLLKLRKEQTELEDSSENGSELEEKRPLKTITELALAKTKTFLTQMKSSTEKTFNQSEIDTNYKKDNAKSNQKDAKKEDHKDDHKDYQEDDHKDDLEDDLKDDLKDDQKDDQKEDQINDQKDDQKNDDKYSQKDDQKNDKKDNKIHDKKDETNIQKDNEKDYKKEDQTHYQIDNQKDDQRDETKDDQTDDQKDYKKDDQKDDEKDYHKDELKDHKKDDNKNDGEDDEKDIVDKIMEIKQKQQELDVAKKELFSNINSTDTGENKNVEKEENKISIDVEIRNNSPDKEEKLKLTDTNIPMKNTNVLNPTKEKVDETKHIIRSETVTDKSATRGNLLKPFPEVISSSESLVKSTEKPGNSSDEIVSKIIEIKQKEQELNHAKENLFSDSNKMSEDDKSKHNVEVKENGENDKMENISNAVANNSESKLVENKNEKKIHIILDVNDKTDKKQPVLENSHNNDNNLK